MQIPTLDLKPPIAETLSLSDDIQQTLAMLAGYAVNQRVLLNASPTGALRTTSGRLIDVKHYTGSGANDHPTLDDIPCTEVLVMGHPDNTGKLWVRNSEAATVNNAWPLVASDAINLSVDNVNQLSILVVVDGEKAIVAIAK